MRAVSALLMAILTCAACSLPGASAHVGYTMMAMEGDVGLSAMAGTGATEQGIDGMGFGSEQGSPYARVQLDLGTPVLTATGFTFQEEASGSLSAPYGSLPAGTAVRSKVSFTNVKGSLAFEFPLGPLSVSPGLAVELFDLDVVVRDEVGIAEETIDWVVPVPMGFLRAQADLWFLTAVAELGYITIPEIQDVEGTFWDADLYVAYRPTPLVEIFAGYRQIRLDGDGEADDRDFAIDLDVAGWMVGGGVSF